MTRIILLSCVLVLSASCKKEETGPRPAPPAKISPKSGLVVPHGADVVFAIKRTGEKPDGCSESSFSSDIIVDCRDAGTSTSANYLKNDGNGEAWMRLCDSGKILHYATGQDAAGKGRRILIRVAAQKVSKWECRLLKSDFAPCWLAVQEISTLNECFR